MPVWVSRLMKDFDQEVSPATPQEGGNNCGRLKERKEGNTSDTHQFE